MLGCMSVITRMVIYTGMNEDDAMARLNKWCEENDHSSQQFQRLDTDAAGGRKWFSDEIWAMAGNYFRHEDLIPLLPTFGWRGPANVVLIVNYEHDECSRVYRAAPEREPSMW
jgi:hypothetical protein